MEKKTKIAIDGNCSEGSQTKLQWTTPKLNSEKISETKTGATFIGGAEAGFSAS